MTTHCLQQIVLSPSHDTFDHYDQLCSTMQTILGLDCWSCLCDASWKAKLLHKFLLFLILVDWCSVIIMHPAPKSSQIQTERPIPKQNPDTFIMTSKTLLRHMAFCNRDTTTYCQTPIQIHQRHRTIARIKNHFSRAGRNRPVRRCTWEPVKARHSNTGGGPKWYLRPVVKNTRGRSIVIPEIKSETKASGVENSINPISINTHSDTLAQS